MRDIRVSTPRTYLTLPTEYVRFGGLTITGDILRRLTRHTLTPVVQWLLS